MSDLKIFSGRSNEPLAEAIAGYVRDTYGDWRYRYLLGGEYVKEKLFSLGGVERRDTPTGNFPDGEQYARYLENLRGSDVFIIQPTNQPDSHIIELCIMADTAKYASARRVTAVMPYFGYSRQDKKDKPRGPASADTMVKMLSSVGVDRLLLLDIHSEGILEAARSRNMNCDHLLALPVFLRHIKNSPELNQFIEEGAEVAAPDVNAGRMASGYAEELQVPLIYIHKERDASSGKNRIKGVIGSCRGKNVLLVDDMIDTAGTTCGAADELRKKGAKRIFVFATHALFSGRAIERIQASVIEKVIVTDSIYHPQFGASSKIERLPVASLLGEAIWQVHSPNGSVSKLFEQDIKMRG